MKKEIRLVGDVRGIIQWRNGHLLTFMEIVTQDTAGF